MIKTQEYQEHHDFALPDEGCPLAHLLELAGPHVGAGGADATEHVEHGDGHVPAVGHRNRLALARPAPPFSFICYPPLYNDVALQLIM